jgi:hypothetical protein
MKRGSLRFSEEKFRELAEGRAWQKASEFPVGVGPHHTNPVATTAIPTLTDAVDIPERDILKDVLGAVTYHPRVAWAERMNSGVMQQGGRYVRFGFVGCPDIIGQLRDGRFLAIEVKRAGKDATEKQLEFLGRVHRNHGLAFVARSAADARNALNEWGEAA